MAGRLARSNPSSTSWGCRAANGLRRHRVRLRVQYRRVIHPTRDKKLIKGNNDQDRARASSDLLTAQQEKDLARIIATGGEAAERARTSFSKPISAWSTR